MLFRLFTRRLTKGCCPSSSWHLASSYVEKIGDQTNGEQVVCVCGEANTGDDNSNVTPAERSLVDFGKIQTTALVGVSYVNL